MKKEGDMIEKTKIWEGPTSASRGIAENRRETAGGQILDRMEKAAQLSEKAADDVRNRLSPISREIQPGPGCPPGQKDDDCLPMFDVYRAQLRRIEDALLSISRALDLLGI